MEEGDEEAGLASRKKKGKVGDGWLRVHSSKTTKDHVESVSCSISFLTNQG